MRTDMKSYPDKQILTLYVHTKSPLSCSALKNLVKISQTNNFKKKYDLKIVEIDKHPEVIEKNNILATPLLILKSKNSEKRILGN